MEARNFPCNQCGARLEFAPGQMALKCPVCQTENHIPEANEHERAVALRELDFLQYFNTADQAETNATVVNCSSCGAEVCLPAQVAADRCPFCATPLILEQKQIRRSLQPKSILPFRVEEKRARAAFAQWIAGLWFAPNALKKVYRLQGGLKGVYLPYWTYDAQTQTEYEGERGEHYWETEYYTENGEQKSRQVQRTNWYRVSGCVAEAFDDVLEPASASLPVPMLEELEPWPLKALEPYRDDYVSGFTVELYRIDLKAGFMRAQQRMEAEIRRSICRDIGGDEQRVDRMTPQYSQVTFKHILLPVWIAAYQYQRKVFRVVVNATTAEVQGERPWSVWKIGFAVLLVLLVVGALLYWGNQ